MNHKTRKKTKVYNQIGKWDGNPISYWYLSVLTKINEAAVRELCIELQNEKLIDSDKNLVWIKRL